MTRFRRLFDLYVLGRHRLQNVEPLPLGCTVSDAITLYGEPTRADPSEKVPQITQYTFSASRYHEAVLLEWNQKVQSITYWSARPDPQQDLRCMLERYQEDSRWQPMETGYWYQREDGKVRLWCSAAPAIGVAYVEFLVARAALQTAENLRQIDKLADITWAPNDAIFALQRQFVAKQNMALQDFANKSDRIAVSPDGKHVFVVRHHQAYDVEDGFGELNCPPEPDEGYSTEVVNCFSWGDDGSAWSKITLPTDAHVDRIAFEDDLCLLQIRRASTNQVLTFRRSASAIVSLSAISVLLQPLNDEELWKGLKEEAGSSDSSSEL